MGIKGIYRELGPGKRVALSKLAADSFVNDGRPFRLAIDFAIWQYQTQAAQGGTNPAIRTLFYRLARLLGTPVEPIFVFDGPNKPAFKRNKRSGRGCSVAAAQAKRLIRLFGFTVHDAPGEAEAECALLQQHGIVDAVLSEDVDTIMFGCTRTLRNWTAEGKGAKTPTHVSLYDVKALPAGLDREGMVLVALMSGGDYLPEGVPGCGVKVACEAAKAGFGSICQLKASDEEGIRQWKESLVHELRTNENGFFRTRHKALVIPEDFPNFEILRYYTHPVISTSTTLDSVREKFHQKREMHVESLREYARETFGWDYRIGAIKFIRVLGQALLVSAIVQEKDKGEGYVKRISSQRTHFSTDGTPELRISYVPQEIVPIDLSKEIDEELSYDRNGLALNSDDEFEADGLESSSGAASAKIYDPSKTELAWVLEAVAKKSVPEAVTAWEAVQAAKAAKAALKSSPKKKKAASTKTKKPIGMPTGALHQYVRVSKTVTETTTLSKPEKDPKPSRAASPTRPTTPRRLRVPSPLETSKPPTSSIGSPVRQRNPWTLASSQETPRTPKPSGGDCQQAILISSSPAGPPPSPSPRPRGAPTGSQGLARQSPSEGITKGVINEREMKPSKASKAPSGSREIKLKQTSLDIFTTKGPKPASSSKPTKSNQGVTSSQPMITSQLKTSKSSIPRRKPLYQPLDSDFDSDSDDLAPLSSFLSVPAPTSPSKRRQNSPLPTTKSPSPSPARKKKLLVPRTSAVGFFREVEVDEDERDKRLERESANLQKRGFSTGVARLSDVAFVDLTGDD
ncbi:Fc.00g030530.m01.CDS01 [Cosmosporella sp. VM-42]